MALAVLDGGDAVRAVAALPDDSVPPGVFPVDSRPGVDEASRPYGQKLAGSLGRPLALEPGQEATATFVIAWHFPNLRLDRLDTGSRWYATKFASAVAVAKYVAKHFERLAGQTRLQRDTWYDSTHKRVSQIKSPSGRFLKSGRFQRDRIL
jgi:beta-glucosidase 2, glycosyl-hydrolase family 116 N-term